MSVNSLKQTVVGSTKLLILVASLALSAMAAAETYHSELQREFIKRDKAEQIRREAYFQIIGINPDSVLKDSKNPLSDNITDVQLVFRPAKPDLEFPGEVSIYAGSSVSVKQIVDLVSNAIGYEVNYSKVSEAQLETKVLLTGGPIGIVDLLNAIEDRTSIDVILYPANAGRYILMVES